MVFHWCFLFRRFLKHSNLLCLIALFNFWACSGGMKANDTSSSTIPCSDFNSLSPGLISLTQNGSDVSVNWATDLSSSSDSLTVSLSSLSVGPGATPAPQSSKPSSFIGLSDAVWTATISYQKANCTSVTTTKVFTVNSAVDCSSWSNMIAATSISVTNLVNGSATINWSGGTVSGQDSFSVQIGGSTVIGSTDNTKPLNASPLNPGAHLATVSYSRSGCTDRVATQNFIVPVSLATHIFPLLISHCSGCHGGSGSFSIGATSNDLFMALTSSAAGSCSPSASHSERVNTISDPGTPANSFFYRKISTSECGTMMSTNGSLSNQQVQYIRDWISEGAQNN